MELILAALLSISILILLNLRIKLRNSEERLSILSHRTERDGAADRSLILYALARELANEMMQRDYQKFRKNFERLYLKWKEIEKSDISNKLAHYTMISEKYKYFANFDEVETQSHVLYCDALSWKSDDDLWDLFENIRLFNALNCELDVNWRQVGAVITEDELNHLRKYCLKLGDTILLAHLHKARDQLSLLEINGKEFEYDGYWHCETPDYKFRELRHPVEDRWGVYVKSLDRYGIWGTFYDRPSYVSFYASNENFEEKLLDDLHIRVCPDMREYKSIVRID